MSDVIKKLDEKIDIDKEMLGLLPRNNLKNRTKTLEKIKEVEEQYSTWHEEIINEIKRRYDKINQIEENPKIKQLEQKLENMNDICLMEDITTSYEKMELDKLIYGINGFYKKDLNTVNDYILECIKKFQEQGIVLTVKDFNYSEYVTEYMRVFLDEVKNGNIHSDKMKNTFEKIYLKCSELITHIALNFRYLYHKNEKNIDKAFKIRKEEILKDLNITEEELENNYNDIKEQLIELKQNDGRIILNRFLSEELIINDYKEENIDNLCLKLKTNGIEIDNEFFANIKKLYSDLCELKILFENKFLIDDIQKIYKKTRNKEKEKNQKSEYDERLQEISALEKKLFQLNTNINKKSQKILFGKKAKESKEIEILERNNKILELKELYRKLDDDMINKTITEKITDASSILDILVFATSYYNFIARDIIKHFPEIEEKDINKMIDRLKYSIKTCCFNVINNANITQEKDIRIIVKDKYKLFGLNISKEDLDEANIEGFINTVNTIAISQNIKNTRLDVESIEFMCKAKSVLKNNL